MGARPIRVVAGLLTAAIILASLYARAQTLPAPAVETATPPAASSPTPTPEAETPVAEAPFAMSPPSGLPVLRTEQLDQLLAPIALYPDALLAQILMAATYPLEIVKARRWLQDPRRAALSGDQLAAALDAETWDPSVKALVTVPPILTMMDTNLDWTEGLGGAFATQQPDVMDAIQRLRQQAAAAGNLWSNAQQNVTEEGQGIVIEPANPSYIYPPLYSPALVYGPWPAPEYPPLDISPPDYGVGFELPFGVSFGAGFVIVNKIWPWCTFDWGQRRIRRAVQTSKAFDRTIREPAPAIWRSDPTHRQGLGSFDFGTHPRLAIFRNPLSVAARSRTTVPPVAGVPSMLLSNSAARAVVPPRMAPAALVVPQQRIAARPMTMSRMAPRQAAARVVPRFVAMAKPPPPGGAPHFDGGPHR